MKNKIEFKENDIVFDRWYYYKACHGSPIQGFGKIIKIRTNSIWIKFSKGIVRYDFAHARQFLKHGTKQNINLYALKLRS